MSFGGAVPRLQGERCLLRALEPADAPSIARHANDPAVARDLFDGFPQPYTLAHAEAWCGPLHAGPEFGHVWAIVVDGEAAGCISVLPQTGMYACNAVVGYWLGRAHWGRGIVTEALALVTSWAWRALPQVQRLYAPIFARHAASQRVAQKAGYLREALIPRSIIKAGEVIDTVQYAAYRRNAKGGTDS